MQTTMNFPGAVPPVWLNPQQQQQRSSVYTWAMCPPAQPSAATSNIPISDLSDEDLMLMLASGFIEQPVAELFRRHNRALFNFVAWLCQGDTALAEDVCQKSWIKLMTRCGDYQPQAAFRTFLYQIARNTWLDIKRSAFEKQRDDLDETAPELPTDDLSPDAELQLKQNLHAVQKALMTLPTVQREAIVLRFFSDMSVEEIAAVVGVGFETIKSRLRYAFAQLRRELGKDTGALL